MDSPTATPTIGSDGDYDLALDELEQLDGLAQNREVADRRLHLESAIAAYESRIAATLRTACAPAAE